MFVNLDICAMYKLVLSLALALCFAIPAAAENEVKPPKGATAVIITTAQTPDNAYIGIGQHLVSMGYSFKSSSDAMRIITTEFQEPNTKGVFNQRNPYSITASVMPGEAGAKIKIVGKYSDQDMSRALSSGFGTYIDAKTEPATYEGPGNNSPKITFKEMLEVAESYPDKTGIAFE